MAKFRNLNVDFRDVMKLSMRDRLDMLQDYQGQGILAGFTPAQLVDLFPRYYSEKLPSVGKNLSGIMSSPVKVAEGKASGKTFATPSTGTGTPSTDTSTPSTDTTTRPSVTSGGPVREGRQIPRVVQPDVPVQPSWQKKLQDATGVTIGGRNAVAKEGTENLKGVAETQKSVYDAFTKAGFSHKQAVALTAEVGRENNYNPNYIFGTHREQGGSAGVRGRINQGMLSFGDPSRRKNFIDFMRKEGFMDDNGNIPRTKEAIEAQARFIRQEMSSYNKASKEFLSNQEPTEEESRRLLSKYIGWDIAGKKIDAPSHIARMSSYYRQVENITSQKDFQPKTSDPVQLPQGLDSKFIAEYEKLSPNQKENVYKAILKLGEGDPASSVSKFNELYRANPQQTAERVSQGTPGGTLNLEENVSRNVHREMGINLTGGAGRRGYASSLNSMNPELMGRYHKAIQQLPEELRAKLKITSAFRDPNDPDIQRQYQQWLAGPRDKPMADPRRSKHGRGMAFDIQLGSLSREERTAVERAFRQNGLTDPVRKERFGDSHTHIELDPNYRGEAAGPAFTQRINELTEKQRKILQEQQSATSAIPTARVESTPTIIPSAATAPTPSTTQREGTQKPQVTQPTVPAQPSNASRQQEVAPPPEPATQGRPTTLPAEATSPNPKELVVRGPGNEEVPVQPFALGGETQAQGPLTAYAIDKDRMRRDDTLVTDGRVKFTMNSEKESMKYNPDTGRVQIDQARGETRQKINPNELGPEARIETPTPEPQPQQQQQMPQVIPQQVSQGREQNSFDTTTSLVDNIFKSASFKRAVAQSRFMKDSDPLGGHYDFGAYNIT